MKHPLLSAGLALALIPCAFAEKTAPKIAEAPSPAYPAELIDTGTNGSAEVDIIVKADGSVAEPTLAMATHRAFGRAAMTAIRSWRFTPAMEDGQPIDRKVSVPFRFIAPFEQVVNANAKRKVFIDLPEPALTDKDFPTKKLKVKTPARPVYPRALMSQGIEEKVQVKFVVGPDGLPLNPSVVGAKHKEFEQPAIQAVAHMAYEPPTKDGKPVYVEAVTTLNFERPEFGGGGGFGGGGRRGGSGGGRGGGGGGGEN